MGIYNSVSKDQGFEMGVRHALTAIIASPKFLYRIESTPEGAEPGSVHRLSDLELASRLSFFVWSSIPDDTLLDLAEAGALHKPEVLQQQVLRMLQDPRATSLSSNFANQWLRLAKMDEVDPDPDLFRGIDFGIRPLLKEEVDLFTRDIFLNNKPIGELLTADFTYMNERLANHYDIGEVKGDQFRKVTLEDYPERKGLLGKGAILMASSYPDRTSPVLRGNYVLEFILGTPPPNCGIPTSSACMKSAAMARRCTSSAISSTASRSAIGSRPIACPHARPQRWPPRWPTRWSMPTRPESCIAT
jgi:hypothetical protein